MSIVEPRSGAPPDCHRCPDALLCVAGRLPVMLHCFSCGYMMLRGTYADVFISVYAPCLVGSVPCVKGSVPCVKECDCGLVRGAHVVCPDFGFGFILHETR